MQEIIAQRALIVRLVLTSGVARHSLQPVFVYYPLAKYVQAETLPILPTMRNHSIIIDTGSRVNQSEKQ